MLNALILLLVLVPALQFFPLRELSGCGGDSSGDTSPKKSTAQWRVLTTRRFWMIAPAVTLLSFTTTGVFFYQLIIAQSRGWSAAWYALVFSGYAASRFLFGLTGGPLVDRFSAKRLFPFLLLPLVPGVTAFALVTHQWAAVVFLISAGAVMGCSGPIKSAGFAELHDVNALGGIRSVYTAFMVLGTALGPMFFGYPLDAGAGFPAILLGAAAMLAAASLNSFRLLGMNTR